MYNKDNLKKDAKIKELFKKYTDYVEESGWLACKERELWAKMRGGNIGEFSKIFDYMKQRSKIILSLSKASLKYKKMIPSIPNLNRNDIERTEKKYLSNERNINVLKPLENKEPSIVKKTGKKDKKIARYNRLKPIKEEKRKKNIVNKYKKKAPIII